MSKKTIHETKYLRLVDEDGWSFVERTNGNEVAYIVPILRLSSINYAVFIEEYRKPVKKNVVGFPAGLVGDINADEKVESAARRELHEETGYYAGRLRYLTKGLPSSGLSPENIHIYLADRLRKIDEGGGDESENITVHLVPLNEAEMWLKSKEKEGCAIDIKSYIGLYYAENMDIE